MSEYQPEKATLRAMLGKAEAKLAAAAKDLQDGFYDEAASRAYYATFHAVSAVLAQRGLTFSSHAQVLGAFNRELVKPGLFPPDAFRRIQRLFEDRQIGDYEWNRTVDQETAEQDLADARWLVKTCREYIDKTAGESLS